MILKDEMILDNIVQTKVFTRNHEMQLNQAHEMAFNN